MRVIGLDIHRNFAQVAILESGVVQHHGRFAMERDAVLAFAEKVLTKADDVVLEATGNTAVMVRLLTPFVHRVVIANPLQVRAIAWTKVKTDKIDAATLARLHASQFLPEVWMPTEEVELQRHVMAERTQLVSQMTRLKNRIQSDAADGHQPPNIGIVQCTTRNVSVDSGKLPGQARKLVVVPQCGPHLVCRQRQCFESRSTLLPVDAPRLPWHQVRMEDRMRSSLPACWRPSATSTASRVRRSWSATWG